MSIKFDVTYWKPVQYAVIAEEADVILALTGYIDQEPGDGDAKRAAVALLQLSKGHEPTDLDIVAIALCEADFEAPKGTEPDSADVTSDYTAKVRLS